MKHLLETCYIMHFDLIQVLFFRIFFRTLAGFDAAAIIASAGVTLGLERYLCPKNTFVLIIVALVSFDHTFQNL